AIGDRYAQIGDGASKRVDHPGLKLRPGRCERYIRPYIRPRPENVAPDMIMARARSGVRFGRGPVAEDLLEGIGGKIEIRSGIRRRAQLAAVLQVGSREFGVARKLIADHLGELRPQAGAVL